LIFVDAEQLRLVRDLAGVLEDDLHHVALEGASVVNRLLRRPRW